MRVPKWIATAFDWATGRDKLKNEVALASDRAMRLSRELETADENIVSLKRKNSDLQASYDRANFESKSSGRRDSRM